MTLNTAGGDIDEAALRSLPAGIVIQMLEERRRLHSIVGATGIGIWEWNVQTGEVRFNERWAEMIGYRLEELEPLGIATWQRRAHEDDLARSNAALERPFAGETALYECDVRMRHRNGEWVWVHDRGQLLSRDEAGKPLWMAGIHLDITERKHSEEKLKLYDNVFRYAGEAVLITTPEGSIVEVNSAFTRITGYEKEEVLGQNPRILNSGRQNKAFYAAMWRDLSQNGLWFGEVWNRRKNGELYVQMQTISEVRDVSGRITHYVAVFSDITALKQHERDIEHAIHFDALTQLPNRVLLSDRMRQALMRAKRNSELVAVACIDLDGFGYVNDTHGHDAGDMVLVEAANRISNAVRTDDSVARLGGDEFALLLVGVGSARLAEQTIDRVLGVLATPFYIGDARYVEISGSVGYTLFPEDDADPDTLLRHADHALYQAKQSGKNRYHRFDVKLDTRAKANWSVLAKIEQALDKGQFRLYVQPKVSLADGRVCGAEALIRWVHPIRGLVPPGQFIPLLDGQDLALKVGDWVLREGLRLQGEFGRAGVAVPLSLNVDARQLRRSDFSDQMSELLAAHADVSPGLIELEIVESTALDDIDQISTLIEDCKALGLRFSLDDFGTGYSSLTYLKRLAVDTLKIDQSFVRDMLGDDSAMAIVRGVIGLAEAFGNHTVAEGVETWEHAARLKALGCEIVQGYAVARPMPAEEFPAWAAAFRMPAL